MGEDTFHEHLALRGGLLFSRSLFRYAHKRRLVTTTEEETYADEVLGYAVAGLGFYAQMTWGFDLPFPLSLFMMPFTGAEWYLRYSITAADPPA